MAQRMAGKPFTLFSATELGASKEQHFCGQMRAEMGSSISLGLTDLLAARSWSVTNLVLEIKAWSLTNLSRLRSL